MSEFYVYVLLDPRKPGSFQYRDSSVFDYEPFYIGKGKGDRINQHFGQLHENTQKSDMFVYKKFRKIYRESNKKPIAIKLYENLFEDQAFEIEKFLIKQIGRFNLRLGPLTNLTDGGEGTSGKIESDETKRKKSLALSGRIIGPMPEEQKKKISEKLSGKNHPLFGVKRGTLSEETKQKISMANKGHFPWNTGKIIPSEMKEKIRKSMIGLKQSDETKLKKKESAKAGWEKRRANGSSCGGRKRKS